MATVDILLVGGGGGSCYANSPTVTYARGGGGGQVKEVTGVTVTVQAYSIVVGTGGAKAVNSTAGDGGDTTALGETALGGSGATNTASGDSGGTGVGGTGTNHGGGGDTENGVAGTTSAGGAAGAGTNSSYSGTSLVYGYGGPGSGSSSVGSYGRRVDGSGDGGNSGQYGNGVDGWDGIVIIRYLTADGITASGGTETTDGAYTVHSFLSSGTFTVSSVPGGGPAFISRNNTVV